MDNTNMKSIIEPVPRDLLKSELTPDCFLRKTNKNNNEIYVVSCHNAPNVLREIGRLREIAFRAAGGGTGKDCDIDEFDTMENPYRQLIVWDPREEKILGGYRYLPGKDFKLDANGQPILATSHMFHFSTDFIENYMRSTIELGRSFVTLEYQSTRRDTRSIFTLDNLWDGLGALTVILPEMKYFFGKMTMYPSFDRLGRDMILYFLNKHFGDADNLITTLKPIKVETNPGFLHDLFCYDDFKEDYRILHSEIRKLGFNIPPLVNAYMGLSPTMRVFGTAVNDTFGNVEETGILIAVDEILEEKRRRYIDTFVAENPDSIDLMRGLKRIVTKKG